MRQTTTPIRPLRWIAFLPLLCLASMVWATPVPKAKPAEVVLHPLATDLFVGEQFEAFVRFTNRGEDEVFLFRDWQLQQGYGNVTLEVKGPKDKEFRCPYTVIYPTSGSDGKRPPRERGVKAGGTRCDFVVLPVGTGDSSKELFPVLDTAGEWQVRAKVVFHDKLEKVSSPVVVKVAERTAAEAKRCADTRTAFWRPRQKEDSFGEEFKARMKLIDDLGVCYTADEWRRQMFGFRLSVAGTDQSKQTAHEVMEDIDAYLKTVPSPVRDRLCWALAYTALDRAATDPQAIKIGRKYLAMVDCLPDDWEVMGELFDEAERKLKAKSPDAKPEKK